jgi:hypothetical protein
MLECAKPCLACGHGSQTARVRASNQTWQTGVMNVRLVKAPFRRDTSLLQYAEMALKMAILMYLIIFQQHTSRKTFGTVYHTSSLDSAETGLGLPAEATSKSS